MKTRRELNLEYWGRIHDMCDAYNKQHGTSISPKQCVKINGEVISKYDYDDVHPNFATNPENYQLAVGIVDDTPVFAGDTVYDVESGCMYKLQDMPIIHNDVVTLTPPKPKREFELNGKMLPCPDEDYDESVLELLGEHYYFGSIEDRNKVARAIKDLLDNARDKE
jgi:hypothetical protein